MILYEHSRPLLKYNKNREARLTSRYYVILTGSRPIRRPDLTPNYPHLHKMWIGNISLYMGGVGNVGGAIVTLKL